MDRFAKVTHISTVISLVSCCTLAISAYLVFTDKTQGNILNNFSAVSVSMKFRMLRCGVLKRSEIERYLDQYCAILFWIEHVYNASARAFRM